ncbi:hypothetical protein BV25DRAFT_1917378 [Artomyces pyxidatus]|uniref:Uncharacterized protein n=1 Tax=Artomyces pyxidatus TaxID=48021 RepID=A0ACB8SXE9_9AGAM|nr:hypothetical protein BV25DRAFT_1917378 [Artomyces pyxidatus]
MDRLRREEPAPPWYISYKSIRMKPEDKTSVSKSSESVATTYSFTVIGDGKHKNFDTGPRAPPPMSLAEQDCARKGEWGTSVESRMSGAQVIVRMDFPPYHWFSFHYVIELRPLGVREVYTIGAPHLCEASALISLTTMHCRETLGVPLLQRVHARAVVPSLTPHMGGPTTSQPRTRRAAAAGLMLLGHANENVAVREAKEPPDHTKKAILCHPPPELPLWPWPLFTNNDEDDMTRWLLHHQ